MKFITRKRVCRKTLLIEKLWFLLWKRCETDSYKIKWICLTLRLGLTYWWYTSSAESVRLVNTFRFVAYVRLNLLQLKWLTVNFAPKCSKLREKTVQMLLICGLFVDMVDKVDTKYTINNGHTSGQEKILQTLGNKVQRKSLQRSQELWRTWIYACLKRFGHPLRTIMGRIMV